MIMTAQYWVPCEVRPYVDVNQTLCNYHLELIVSGYIVKRRWRCPKNQVATGTAVKHITSALIHITLFLLVFDVNLYLSSVCTCKHLLKWERSKVGSGTGIVFHAPWCFSLFLILFFTCCYDWIKRHHKNFMSFKNLDWQIDKKFSC